jgi:hypothetical protein
MNLSSQALENIAIGVLHSARIIKTRSGEKRPDDSSAAASEHALARPAKT